MTFFVLIMTSMVNSLVLMVTIKSMMSSMTIMMVIMGMMVMIMIQFWTTMTSTANLRSLLGI